MFKEYFENKVKETIEEYSLFSKKDKVLLALSGGKDSSSLLVSLKNLGYDVYAFYLDLQIGLWSKKNEKAVEELCDLYKVPLKIIDIKEELGYSMCFIRSAIQQKTKLRNCTICGVMKRYLMNKVAKKMKADYIATGHNLDDEIEVYFMNLFKANTELFLQMGPKKISSEGMVNRVKPLYLLTNDETRQYCKELNLPVIFEKCPCAHAKSLRNELRDFVNKNISRDGKEALIKNFYSKVKKYQKESKHKLCIKCGEPSRNDICKTCSLFGVIS